jgi:hypothetical protein
MYKPVWLLFAAIHRWQTVLLHYGVLKKFDCLCDRKYIFPIRAFLKPCSLLLVEVLLKRLIIRYNAVYSISLKMLVANLTSCHKLPFQNIKPKQLIL